MTTSVKADYALRAILDLASQKTRRTGEDRGHCAAAEDTAEIPGIDPGGAETGGVRGVAARGRGRIPAGAGGGFDHGRRGDTVGGWPAGGHRCGRSKTETPFTDMWDRVDLAVAAIIDHTSIGNCCATGPKDRARAY